jgi:DNA-binding NarL/FixJ family response regulator
VALVDDDPLVRAWVRAQLASSPRICVTGQAGSAAEALQFVAQTPVDVMLVDIAMREMTGIALTVDLLRRCPGVRIVIFSMHKKASYVSNAISAGAHGYVLKNPDPDEIIHAVTTVASGGTFYGAGVPRPERAAKQLQKRLTPREAEVLSLVAKGLKNGCIAERLGISVSTVMRHRLNFREKLGLDTPIDIRRYAEEQGLVAE